jgi:hypothetical protein
MIELKIFLSTYSNNIYHNLEYQTIKNFYNIALIKISDNLNFNSKVQKEGNKCY